MWGRAAFEQRNVAVRFESRTSRQALRSIRSTEAWVHPPTLFTRMSSRPRVRAEVDTARRQSAGRVRSARIATPRRPIASIRPTTLRASASRVRNVIATSAPPRARARAIPFPILRDPPVTRAARPSRPTVAPGGPASRPPLVLPEGLAAGEDLQHRREDREEAHRHHRFRRAVAATDCQMMISGFSFRDLEGFLRDFTVSPCNIVLMLSNRMIRPVLFKYIDAVYTF